MLRNIAVISALLGVTNAVDPPVVAEAPSFKFGGGSYTPNKATEGQDVSTFHCNTFLGYQLFDFRVLDKNMR